LLNLARSFRLGLTTLQDSLGGRQRSTENGEGPGVRLRRAT
jgi:hypothetical protein